MHRRFKTLLLSKIGNNWVRTFPLESKDLSTVKFLVYSYFGGFLYCFCPLINMNNFLKS